jgi:hypothetical protein
MVQQRPRVRTDTLDDLSALVEPLGVDVQEASVDRQLRALLEAYGQVVRRNRELDNQIRALESGGGSPDASDLISISSGSAEAAAESASTWDGPEYEGTDDDPPGRTTHLR